MNSKLLKRLFRAIGSGSEQGLDQLARVIVEDERQKGHTRLADELGAILVESEKSKPASSRSSGSTKALRELPTSRRYKDLMVTLIPHDELEHHMVLASHVELRFQRIEKEYAARERLGVYGLQPKKKILLYGPPGCGKTLGAKRLAWNTGLNLMKIRFDAVISSLFGETASNLRAIFDAAEQQPCLLLLDECDFIARSRTASGDVGEAPRIVNALLQLLDDFTAPGMVVATTNIDKSLDPALFRRFDDDFEIPLPGVAEIRKLLTMTLSTVQVEQSLDWSGLVAKLEGMSAAQVVKVAQDAAKLCVLESDKTVAQHHFDLAVANARMP